MGTPGTAAWIASFVRFRSARIASGDRLPSARSCRQVWLHRVCPSWAMACTSPGLAWTFTPMRQNVAFTPFARNSARICVVYGPGPSSKVSAIAAEPVVRNTPAVRRPVPGTEGDADPGPEPGSDPGSPGDPDSEPEPDPVPDGDPAGDPVGEPDGGDPTRGVRSRTGPPAWPTARATWVG